VSGVVYRLEHSGEIYLIQRIETIGPFSSREAAREWMITTTAEREARDTGLAEEHRRTVEAVRGSLQLADTPEDRHGTYAHRHSTNALRHDTTRSVEERRRDWLHTHAGEPLPPELRTREEAQDA
jgi:hypothetical protein